MTEGEALPEAVTVPWTGADPASVDLLGFPEPLFWRREATGIHVNLPSGRQASYAFVLALGSPLGAVPGPVGDQWRSLDRSSSPFVRAAGSPGEGPVWKIGQQISVRHSAASALSRRPTG